MDTIKNSQTAKKMESTQRGKTDIESPLPEPVDGVVIGVLLGFDNSNRPKIVFPGCNEEGVIARSTKSLTSLDIGKSIALLFEGGDPDKPIIIGFMHPVAEERISIEESKILHDDEIEDEGVQDTSIEIDGKRVELNAEEQIVLRCGASSITLTKAGKILVRGKYLLSRSSGVNRIKGGSVQIN